MPKVFIVNKSKHDFSKAAQFGELVFCTEGRMNRFATNDMFRNFEEAMQDSTADDYILPCSLNIANIIACVVFAKKHDKINLLLFKPSTGEYIERNHILED